MFLFLLMPLWACVSSVLLKYPLHCEVIWSREFPLSKFGKQDWVYFSIFLISDVIIRCPKKFLIYLWVMCAWHEIFWSLSQYLHSTSIKRYCIILWITFYTQLSVFRRLIGQLTDVEFNDQVSRSLVISWQLKQTKDAKNQKQAANDGDFSKGMTEQLKGGNSIWSK